MSFLKSSVAFPVIMYCRILDLFLIKNIKNSCRCKTRSEVNNLPPQMERDVVHADKYKADIYSMAKTIWIILTSDMKSFERHIYLIRLLVYVNTCQMTYISILWKNYCHNVLITMETPILMRWN
ncbi:hypothetical protein HMPREF1981_00736 [Bacteroides pyogenes F0041]|uniref:Uncharacterized protein n=1 Tax=Bacteroides pyogenes F0041 TaxID=1321819 RepID=U2E3L6_9BACE|nr:hypothetical protein HMPREF1981_00736 [Bacteroides pyogenes F0041]MBB3893705.1 hypothetical protein [Bacteroides pyogenes]SUV33561.1 Uncharacterised protein [Bacteroides pyogenes]